MILKEIVINCTI